MYFKPTWLFNDDFKQQQIESEAEFQTVNISPADCLTCTIFGSSDTNNVPIMSLSSTVCVREH